MDMLTEALDIAKDKEYASRIISSNKFDPLSESDAVVMKTLLANTQDYLGKAINEGSFTSDVAQFTPILMPIVRRVFPKLIANDLLGVQPMAMPTGYVYALVNQYLGNDTVGIAHKFGEQNWNPRGVIYEVSGVAAQSAGQTNLPEAGQPVNGANDKVLYAEMIAGTIDRAYILAQKEDGVIAKGTVLASGVKVEAVFSNEASFNRILRNYSGAYSTEVGERLGDEMNQVGFSILRKSIEAQTRALKGKYTIEMYQDLKAQHGLQADDELMNLIQYEIQAEIDRDVIKFVNDNAKLLSDTTFGFSNPSVGTPVIDGRWEIERYRSQVIRISKEATMIGIENKRGAGNILLVSPMVATMLQQVGNYVLSPLDGKIEQPVAGGVAGMFDGRYKVIVDQYAVGDYCTVLYKGNDRRDGMGFFCPYVPLNFTKVTNYHDAQPAIIAKTRYALTTTPGISAADSNDRAEQYAHTFGVNLSNTVLGL